MATLSVMAGLDPAIHVAPPLLVFPAC